MPNPCVCSLLSWFHILPFWFHKQTHAMKDQNAANNPTGNSGTQPLPVPNALPSTPEKHEMSKQADGSTCGKQHETHKLVLQWVTVVLTLVIAGIYWSQLTQMREAVRVASESNRATLDLQWRVAFADKPPDVFIRDVQWEHPQTGGGKIRAIVVIANKGKSYVTDVRVAAAITVNHLPPNATTRAGFSQGDYNFIQGRSRIMPLDHPSNPPPEEVGLTQYVETVDSISADQLAEFAKQDLSIYLWGVIKYTDAFNHEGSPIPFCRFIGTRVQLNGPNGSNKTKSCD